MSRRQVLGLLGVGALTACAPSVTSVTPRAEPSAVGGPARDIRLRARPITWDAGTGGVSTWAYGDGVPGPVIRATAGERVRVHFTNALPVETSIHWHGLAIRNEMDGVPGVTTAPIRAGATFDYDFVVPDAGTHWFHPHTGLQLDTGLYAPFIVDDPREPGDYDHEWIVVLDDWLSGRDPEQVFAQLQDTPPAGMRMGMGGMDGGDVDYPLYLINGRAPADPDVLRAKPGQRIRVRIINAAADTMFTVALGGHEMTITHTDGFPVQPSITGALRVAMGERYDLTVTAGDGWFPLLAQAVGRAGYGLAVLGTGARSALSRPAELDRRPTLVSDLGVAPASALPQRVPDATADLLLTGPGSGYVWTINGRTYDVAEPLTVGAGELLRLRMRNMSMMSHPMHLHGHTFQVGDAGGTGARKDTVLIAPMAAVAVDVLADNPGKWMLHCHNAYHAEAGMMTRLDYI